MTLDWAAAGVILTGLGLVCAGIWALWRRVEDKNRELWTEINRVKDAETAWRIEAERRFVSFAAFYEMKADLVRHLERIENAVQRIAGNHGGGE